MERREVEHWLEGHPEVVHADPHLLLDRAEREVRAHAEEDAWLRARSIVEAHLRHFQESFGLPASDAFVAKEVCHQLAGELRKKEPSPSAETSRLSESLLRPLEAPARELLAEWTADLARREEHRAWLGVVSFTDHLAQSLQRGGELSDALSWDFAHSYPRTAERIVRLLIREYEARARGPELVDDIE
jgi:hypothetical protein